MAWTYNSLLGFLFGNIVVNIVLAIVVVAALVNIIIGIVKREKDTIMMGLFWLIVGSLIVIFVGGVIIRGIVYLILTISPAVRAVVGWIISLF